MGQDVALGEPSPFAGARDGGGVEIMVGHELAYRRTQIPRPAFFGRWLHCMGLTRGLGGGRPFRVETCDDLLARNQGPGLTENLR